MNKQREALYLFIFILLSLTVFFVYTEFYTHRVKSSNDYIIEKGVLDLSANDLPEQKVIGLNGTTEFYWNQLLTPADFENDTTIKPDGYITIPGVWNNFEINDTRINGKGYATYRFKILVNTDQQYAIRIKEFDTAYKMWVNNKQIEVGKVGTSSDSMEQNWKRQEIVFESDNGVIDVVLQISNFSHRKGGAEDRMFFGRANDLLQYKQRGIITNAFLLGILAILSIYHFILFVYRHEKSTGIFSILCLMMAIRLSSTNEKLIFEVFPNIDWLLAIKAEYLSYKIALPLLVGFIHSLYPGYVPRRLVRWLYIIAGLFSAIVLFTPVQFFSYTPIFYQLVLAFGAIYAFIALVKASVNNEENALIILAGYVVFFALLANDMLYYNKIINTSFLMHYGLFILAVSQAIVLSRKFSISFFEVEVLSSELEKHNQKLEQTIWERTREIQKQKEEIEHQAENLSAANTELKSLTEFKENLTQMIVHDLKNPLSVILNLSNNEQVKLAGTQMLNLVQNLLDIQRYENSKMELNNENFAIIEAVEIAIEQFQYLIKQKNINLNIDVEEQDFVLADQEIIVRVIGNLLSNAVRFTPYKGLISISTSKNDDHILFKITDNGPGIPEDQEEQIFKKFGQYISDVGKQKGTSGIGLTFCKLAIEAHGGNIYYKTTEGQGTTFFFTIPTGQAKGAKSVKTLQQRQADYMNISLSAEEKEALKRIIEQLNQLQIYQISEIKQSLTKAENLNSMAVREWVRQVKNAVFNSDVELYRKLLKAAK